MPYVERHKLKSQLCSDELSTRIVDSPQQGTIICMSMTRTSKLHMKLHAEMALPVYGLLLFLVLLVPVFFLLPFKTPGGSLSPFPYFLQLLITCLRMKFPRKALALLIKYPCSPFVAEWMEYRIWACSEWACLIWYGGEPSSREWDSEV